MNQDQQDLGINHNEPQEVDREHDGGSVDTVRSRTAGVPDPSGRAVAEGKSVEPPSGPNTKVVRGGTRTTGDCFEVLPT